MKQLKVFHPFLFAISPILFLFVFNMDEVSAVDLLLPMLVVVVGTLLLLLSMRFVVKSYNKIGIIVSFTWVWFFSYGHLEWLWQHLEGTFLWWHPALITGLLWLLILAAVVFLVIKARRDFATLTKFLNITIAIFVAISLINIGVFSIRAVSVAPNPEEIGEGNGGVSLDSQQNSPDIYYIILDTYLRADVLEEFYGFDNSEFLGYLADKGFYVADESRSNYCTTPSSLSSSLNMEYINYLSDIVGVETKSAAVLYQMVEDNKVSRLLKSEGYHYVLISTGLWSPYQTDTYAEVFRNQRRLGITNFSSSLLQSTPLRPIVAGLLCEDYRDGVLFEFGALANMPNYYDEPVFVFAHILCPHPPFLFDRNGDIPEGEGTYIDQLVFANKMAETIIDEILSKSSTPPIIILQGDTGNDYGVHSILNAYFFPEKGYDLLYETITPVNSFRVVFNLYFGAEYELLEDECYDTDYEFPFRFIKTPSEGNID